MKNNKPRQLIRGLLQNINGVLSRKDVKKKPRTKNKISLPGILLVGIFIASFSVVIQGDLFGYSIDDLFSDKPQNNIEKIIPTTSDLKSAGYSNIKLSEKQPGIWELIRNDSISNGMVISSSFFSGNIKGYGGSIPILIFLDSNRRIQKVVLLENNENPDFISDVVNSPVLRSWKGKTVNEALNLKVDAISGATISSQAIIKSIKLSLNGLSSGQVNLGSPLLSGKNISAIVLLLLTIAIVFINTRDPWYRRILLVLNVVVLGLWCGNFISVSFLTNWFAEGNNFSSEPVQVALLAIVLIGGVSGKKNLYCNWVCPFGAAQELTGHISKKKWKIPLKTMKFLDHAKESILILLMVLVWLNITTTVFNYEPFAAFQFLRANYFTIGLAVVFLLLSIFINKPWCRFVCPTGQLLNWIHK